MARGEGAVVEDVDGNVYLDCCAGIAIAATGHSHPDVVRAIVEQASASFTFPPTTTTSRRSRLAKRSPRLRRSTGARGRFFEFRNRSRRGGDQAGALSHEAPEHHRVSRIVSRPHARVAVADVEQERAAPRLRPDGAGRVSRAVRQSVSLRRGRTAPPNVSLTSRNRFSCIWSRPTKSPRSSSSRFRARAATSSRRRSSSRVCRASRSSTACC